MLGHVPGQAPDTVPLGGPGSRGISVWQQAVSRVAQHVSQGAPHALGRRAAHLSAQSSSWPSEPWGFVLASRMARASRCTEPGLCAMLPPQLPRSSPSTRPIWAAWRLCCDRLAIAAGRAASGLTVRLYRTLQLESARMRRIYVADEHTGYAYTLTSNAGKAGVTEYRVRATHFDSRLACSAGNRLTRSAASTGPDNHLDTECIRLRCVTGANGLLARTGKCLELEFGRREFEQLRRAVRVLRACASRRACCQACNI